MLQLIKRKHYNLNSIQLEGLQIPNGHFLNMYTSHFEVMIAKMGPIPISTKLILQWKDTPA